MFLFFIFIFFTMIICIANDYYEDDQSKRSGDNENPSVYIVAISSLTAAFYFLKG